MLCIIYDKELTSKTMKVIFYSEGVLRIKGWICAPRVGDLTRLIMTKACSLRNFIHREEAIMYQDLKQHQW